MSERTKQTLLFLVIFSILIRLSLMSVRSFIGDLNSWSAWSLRLSTFDFNHFYSSNYFSDYTPGYLYILSLIGFLKNLFQIPDSFFYLFLKIPATVAEVLIGFLTYKIVRKYGSEKLAYIALLSILFNPAMIFNSSVWGQIDGILTLLLLISIVGLKNNNLVLSSTSFALAILIKPQALSLVPIFIFYFAIRFNIYNLFKLLIPGLLTIFIFSYPFFPNQTLLNLAQHILNTANGYPYTSVNAYNLWGLVGFWIDDRTNLQTLTFQSIGFILFISAWILTAIFYFKKRINLFVLASMGILFFYFLLTRMHERYLYPAISFLIITCSLYKSRLLIFSTIALTIIHFLNLYYIYVYYNEFYLKLPKLLYNPILYNFLDANGKLMSFLSTLFFVLIIISIVKYSYAEGKDHS